MPLTFRVKNKGFKKLHGYFSFVQFTKNDINMHTLELTIYVEYFINLNKIIM